MSIEFFQESDMGAAQPERRTANDDLIRAAVQQRFGAARGADASTDTYFYVLVGFRSAAQLSHQAIVLALAHCGVKINDMQPWIVRESFQKPVHIFHRKFTSTPMNQLDGLATLQVDARD
jgi:hypothetical protein